MSQPFIAHTLIWIRGEMFEGMLMGVAGLVLLLLAGILWKFGTSPFASALILPLVVCGLIFVAASVSGHVVNSKRLEEFSEAYQKDAPAFIAKEQVRVEGFEALYRYTIIGSLIGFVLAGGIFWFTHNPHWRAFGVALVLMGLAGLIVDMFSRERAVVYQQAIQAQLSLPAAP